MWQERELIALDELYGTAIGTETPRGLKTLVSRLEILLPGIRLRDKLAQAAGHQEIADVLCLNGCLGTRVLNVLRTSEIEFLDLVPSMAETDGLNLDTHDMLKVFAKSNSFLFLNEINLCGVTLRTSDVMNLHHLPRLARLWLKNTSVGNEAIFLLLPLKRSLLELDVSENLAINDDVVVAFTMLSKLRYLAFAGTSVTMEGIRLLASSLGPHRHDMEVEIPEACKEYLDNMNTKYIVSPDPLLVTDPQIVQSLSTLEIIENLTAHSTINSEIPVEGPRLLLIKQLKEILQTREADLQVRHLLGLE
ncbi:hypothetical protein PHLGIDRAFT_491810 [Phlebiopsis gigantea 11061_1 CR5-6]|uniref:Uncharacterized protein n=1 Tax=Phlebiopsis gigantea (strain 11061_1 CR5-6) TaxID=745531 RepID=A0A0C3SCK7_PHLG1|nr:hypothetical protein PHLGIDRAFT_491810 [Phlebiopsis gigantea 11061_1 CR5-6]